MPKAWIRQAIMRAIAEKSRTVRLRCHLSEKFMRIRKVQQELSQKFGRPATITEIAKIINVQPTQVREYLAAFRQPVSLDLQVGEKETRNYKNFYLTTASRHSSMLLKNFFLKT
ncbi:MAG: sigma-70 domain-containing protein [Nostoc sp. DedQUE01]